MSQITLPVNVVITSARYVIDAIENYRKDRQEAIIKKDLEIDRKYYEKKRFFVWLFRLKPITREKLMERYEYDLRYFFPPLIIMLEMLLR